MKYAKVFISRLGGDEEKQETLSVLASASGFFRKELAKHLKLRYTPVLSFQWDDSIERGDHLLQMLDAVTSDNDYLKTSGSSED